MLTIRLLIQYDGTGFVGWQRQESGASIQGTIEDALAKIEGSAGRVWGRATGGDKRADELIGMAKPVRKGRLSPRAVRHAERLQALRRTDQRFVVRLIDLLEGRSAQARP